MTSKKLHIAPHESIQESFATGGEVTFLCGFKKVVTEESFTAPPKAKCRRCRQLHKALVKADLADPDVKMSRPAEELARYTFRRSEVTEFPYYDEKDAS